MCTWAPKLEMPLLVQPASIEFNDQLTRFLKKFGYPCSNPLIPQVYYCAEL